MKEINPGYNLQNAGIPGALGRPRVNVSRCIPKSKNVEK